MYLFKEISNKGKTKVQLLGSGAILNDDEGLMLEEELLDKVSWLIKKESIWEVGFDEDLEEWYVMYEEESNEGWFDLEEVLEKGVFEIV